MISGLVATVASFVLVLGILVFVHEFGHFIVAKAFGIGVPVFSLGFGPRLLGFRRGGTDYRVSAFPLGGYVRMAGDESDENRTGAPEEFPSHPRWQRLLVFVAGGIFNIALALVVTWLVLWVYGEDRMPVGTNYPVVADVRPASTAASAGVRVGDRIVSVAGGDMRDPKVEFEEILMSPRTRKSVVIERDGARQSIELETGSEPRYAVGSPGWVLLRDQSGRPLIDRVMAGSPAEKAGLVAGDRVLGADDQEPIDEIHLRALLAASPGRAVNVKIERAGKESSVAVTPRTENGRGIIGVLFKTGDPVHLAFGPIAAIGESVRVNLDLSKTLFVTLGKVIRGRLSVRAFSGPIEIASVSREMVKRLESFLGFLAFISLQLGVLNLLPVPVLDGGHIVILGLEAVSRRDFSDKVKERLIQTGLVALLVFFAFILYFDADKIGAFDRIKGLFAR